MAFLYPYFPYHCTDKVIRLILPFMVLPIVARLVSLDPLHRGLAHTTRVIDIHMHFNRDG